MRQALLLQRAGYNVLHVAYFNAPGKPDRLSRVPLEDFFQALEWLENQPTVNASKIGIVGYSKGAEAALLIGTHFSGLRAIVAGMPSSVAWDALDPIDTFIGGINSSWTLQGNQVPSLRYGHYDEAQGVFSVFINGLKKRDSHPDTIIPVERITARVLLVCGERDTLWPSCLMADQVRSRAAKSHAPVPILLRYPEAGHGVMGAPAPANHPDIKGFAKLGGTAEGNAAARQDSWPKIVAFLDTAFSEGR
jgi:hypothetical protein